MSRLCITPIASPRSPGLDSADPVVIARELGARGVRFERWDASITLPVAATQADILAAYAADVARLQAAGPYPSCDVVRLAPDPADPAGSRARAAAGRRPGGGGARPDGARRRRRRPPGCRPGWRRRAA